MTSETFDNLCNQIYWQLYNKLERKDDPNLRFATNGTAERVLHEDLLNRLFRCLPEANHTVVQQFGLPGEELAARVDERDLHKFLAVLIFASCGIEAARIFTRKLVAANQWPLVGDASEKGIQTLPASRRDLLGIFRDTVIVDKFCSSQACFSTVTIQNRQETPIESLTSQRLPYLEEKEIGSGDFGKVFRVKIAKGHFKDPRRGTLNDEPMEVARKDYITTNEFGDEERKTIEKILNGSNRRCVNILGNYGSIRVGVCAYSLFMPCAICDLRAYMTSHHPTRPTTTLEKAEMVLAAQGIAEGLDFLHNEMKTPDQEDMVCYHMDLKPSNILVFLDAAYDGGTRYVWKLSDFGMARVKIRKRGQTVEQNFNKSFLHRSQPEAEQSVSRTVNRRGQGTYLPPESLKKTPTMTTSSDVWALGCVLSVVFAFLEDGIEGVNNYQTKRLQHPQSEGFDRFFLRGRFFQSNEKHPEVHKWHHHLIKKAAHRQAEEEDAVRYMLTYLEEKVLVVDEKKRDNVRTVKERLAETYARFKKMPPIERSSAAKGGHPKWINKIIPSR
jgi:serine/threonine protein kinase